MDVVESYQFEVNITELVEIVRALDIMGAERRLAEYEFVLYVKLKEIFDGEREWSMIFKRRDSFMEEDIEEAWLSDGLTEELPRKLIQRLPMSVTDRFNAFQLRYEGDILCSIGSQCIILSKSQSSFFFLIHDYQHFSVARWLYDLLGGINIHQTNEDALQTACSHGNLDFAQWLYSCGGVNIHVLNDICFRKACQGNHFHVVQWLYSLGGIEIDLSNNKAFRIACLNGHLEIAQWLYSV
jgi:hypothetical protein